MSKLRDYQTAAVGAVRGHWTAGVRSVCLVAPTGAGKTRMGEELADGAERVLWVVHRREIVTQTAERLVARFGPGAVGCVMPGEPHRPGARIQVGTVQTLLAQDGQISDVRTLVVDEGHHYALTTTWSGLLARYPSACVVGLTATPERKDGSPLGDVYDRLVVARSYGELVADRVLVPARVYRPARKLGHDLAQDPVEAWMAYGEGAQTFISCARVLDAKALARRFNERGVQAACIDANTPTIERDDIMRRFRDGRIRVLTNVDVLTEGVDVPNARCAVLARAFGHVGAYLQTVGRVLRSAPGKKDAIVLDLCGTTHRHGMPTDDREYSLDGRAISEAAGGGGGPSDSTGDGSEVAAFVQEVLGEPLVLAGAECTPAPQQVDSVAEALAREEARRNRYEELVEFAAANRLGKGHADLRFRAEYGEWPPSRWWATRRVG